VVSETGNRRHQRAIGTVINRLREGARDCAVGARSVSQGEGINGKVGRGSYVRRHVGIRARGNGGAIIAPIDEVVSETGNRRHQRAIGTVINRLREGARNRAVGARSIGQGEGVDGEVGGDRFGCAWNGIIMGLCLAIAPACPNVLCPCWTCNRGQGFESVN